MSSGARELFQADGLPTALPDEWATAWGHPSPFYRRQLVELRQALEELSLGLPLIDEGATFGPLVSPSDNQTAPIHRWYSYKEAFSYRLPKELVSRLGAGGSGFVADPFGGVATTALSLQGDPRVGQVISVEYSPFAHLIGQAKLEWHELDPRRVRTLIRRALNFTIDRTVKIPELAAFRNREIFKPTILRGLLSARAHLNRMKLTPAERAFFITGLASVIEDLSGVMKDGRALRILRDRQRKEKCLVPREVIFVGADRVKNVLAAQWAAMVEDLEVVAIRRNKVPRDQARHLRGDARDLARVRWRGRDMFPPESIGLFLYSPPYLNCIDYSEVYKLELWLLEFVTTQEQFRKLRLGTMRSHPSLEFPARGYLAAAKSTLVNEAVELIAGFVESNNARPDIGRMIRNYFDDMYQVFADQHEALEPGGYSVCVVGNSTFSRRDKSEGGRAERWRVPLLTDVILARLAQTVGFTDAQIWRARDLRPRNVSEGSARESLVVVRKT